MTNGKQAPKCIGYYNRYPEWPHHQCGCDDCRVREGANYAVGATYDGEVVIRDTYPKPVGFELPEEEKRDATEEG